MIKLEHTIEPSPEQMMFVIEGMRNPMNSWRKRDSELYFEGDQDHIYTAQYWGDVDLKEELRLGPNDKNLMKKLAKAGTDHRKFMRMMPVMVRITAPLYWWKEFDTYKVGTVTNSCSTMHKITEKKFTVNDFSHEHLIGESAICNLRITINELNEWRSYYLEQDAYEKESMRTPQGQVKRRSGRYPITECGLSKKDIWWQIIQLLPSSYNQTRNVMLNYEVLYNIYHARKNHKLDEWKDFCKWIETLEFSFLITGEDILKEGLREGLQPGA